MPGSSWRSGQAQEVDAAAAQKSALPATKPQPAGTLVKALARSWRWQRPLDAGAYTSITEIADAERINPSYVSRVLRLTMLVPDIVERILEGRRAPDLAQLMKPFPAEWGKQREQLC
jgi:hypothetical protein